MLNKNYHRLLKRQLKKAGLDNFEDQKFSAFLKLVNDAYENYDEDLNYVEHVLDESSDELFKANQELKRERDRTKTQLENIVANVGGIIFETDLKGNFTFLNDAWLKYTGFTAKESIGKSFRGFLDKDNIISNKNTYDLFSGDNKQLEFIFKFYKGDQLFWFETKSKLVSNSNGEGIGYIGTIIDITTLKETEIELHNASRAKDNFLSTMSHEIRTPLNAVTGLTNIMLMEDYKPEQEENLKALKYSGEHLLGLINDLLDFNKIKSGKVDVVEKTFNIKYFLENIQSHFALRAEKKGVVFNVVKENSIPDYVIGDELKLTQIVKNLLSNSLKFTEKGSIVLCVNNLGKKENKVNLEFKVKDTGIGVSKSKQETIFESFMQADADTSLKYGGTGLGLAICKKLLKLQESDLILESEEGKGSIFSFTITYKTTNRFSDYKPEMVEQQPDYKFLNLNVLIAEDNKMNVLILRRFLEKWNVKYQVANNGKEALSYFKREDFNFDIVLMDLQMPILDGYETTKAIRNLPDLEKASIPIVALTAFAQKDIKEKTKVYKMDDFIGKPFAPERLYKVLSKYCRNNLKKQSI
ncbi:ATP-binding protein [Neotamlana laminarinivorans]|uniref:histidine kinase n=1 Tax=Neotamlana laminarinivorans TaxID=2883124 RepID=A0A9X1I0Y5_9FLAO|nr:ATP-binding protein [Tamlana laminarinivorans]MCB4799221.1 response regulator [Tamlana laminarinivorans]